MFKILLFIIFPLLTSPLLAQDTSSQMNSGIYTYNPKYEQQKRKSQQNNLPASNINPNLSNSNNSNPITNNSNNNFLPDVTDPKCLEFAAPYLETLKKLHYSNKINY